MKDEEIERPDFAMLKSLVDADIEREGEYASTMVRAGLLRDVLEAASRTRALEEALRQMNAHIGAMQHQCRQYIEPSGYTSFDSRHIASAHDEEAKMSLFISDTIYLLDGPEQRDVQDRARQALTGEMGK